MPGDSGSGRVRGDPRPAGRAAAAGTTAQFVVGIGKESDRDFLTTSHRLWRARMLHHPHFAAFRPIEDTPLENAIETPLLRENRLYQADHLLREYAFEPEELVFAKDGNLPFSRDPKLSWALAHPERFPVEATTADRGTLLRVPGLGPRTVDRLLAARRDLANLDSRGLRALGAVASARLRFPRLARPEDRSARDPGHALPAGGFPRAVARLRLFARHLPVDRVARGPAARNPSCIEILPCV